MSEPKTEYHPTFAFGSGVWVKVMKRIWWPGTVVDPLTVPKDLSDFAKGVNAVAVVKFETESKYEVVYPAHPIFPYVCDQKQEFIEKGYSAYKNQMKGRKTVGNFNMEDFLNDVIFFEGLIGGDTFVFENIDKKIKEVEAAKLVFTPTNAKKSKKKESGRKSLPVTKTPNTPNQPTLVSIPKTAPLPRSAPRPRTAPQPKVAKTYNPNPSSAYTCQSRVGCNFTTNRYTNLQRHIALHKDDTDVVPAKKPSTRSTSSKRKNLSIISLEIKKQKLQEELLKDWEDEEVQSTSKVQLFSDVVQLPSNVHSIEEVVPTTSEAISTTNVLSSKNDVIPTISKEIPTTSEVQESSSNKVFDFNENDNNTPVVELRQSNSDCSPTVDDTRDTFESQLTSASINNTIFEASPKKSTEDSLNKPHDILSNELDDQTRSTALLLDKTVNVLDQINHFENSLSGISSSINESDANILTEDNNVAIGVSESCDEYLEEPSSLNQAIHTETNGISIPLVKNVLTEDHAIVEENSTDKEIVSNDVEVNQLSGTTIDNDMHIENSCSGDSTSNIINCEEKISTKKVSLPNTEWTKERGWQTYAETGVTEVYSPPWIDLELNDPEYWELSESVAERHLDFAFKTTVSTPKSQDGTQQNFMECPTVEIYVPLSYGPYPTMEELNANPLTAELQRQMLERLVLQLSIDNKFK